MTDKTMRRFGSARTIAATPLAVAILALTCAMPASAARTEAGWLARGAGVAGAGYALKENLGDLVDRFDEMTDAAFSGDSAKAADVWAKVKGTPGRIVKDAFPVLKLGDAALAAKARVKDRLESAERKVGRFVRRTGEAAADVRAALAVGKRERDWYESGTGVLAKEPLPVAVVSGARTAPAPQAKADPWGAAPTAAAARSPDPGGATGGGAAVGRVWNAQGTGSVALPADWRDRQDPWDAAPTAAAARSPEPGGVTDGGAAAGYVWNAEGTGIVALPSDWREPKGTATAAADPDDAYAAALDAALGDDPTTGSGDYRAALGALETREAERQEAERVAAARREAERQEAERVAAARREAERREAERVAAAERREAERQMRRDAEDARRRQEQFVNSIQQTVNTMQQTLQTLQGSGTSRRGSGPKCTTVNGISDYHGCPSR